jgi:hypothetical protein
MSGSGPKHAVPMCGSPPVSPTEPAVLHCSEMPELGLRLLSLLESASAATG